MQILYDYTRQLTPEEIAAGVHRDAVGGLWEEVGSLQLRFMQQQGLRSADRLLDIGCGALRGGIHFLRYLEPGCYYGIDANASLIAAGQMEVERAGLREKRPQLLVTDAFEVARFGVMFDYVLAVSVFTHLHANRVLRCLLEVRRVMAPGAGFFATVFEAPAPGHLAPIAHQPGGITSFFDADPFHYAQAEMAHLGHRAGLEVGFLGDWGHPRAQTMLRFVRKD
jgi:SAM-dependent methyltransferase